ncbi:DUF5052 family protein [Bacillus massiliigorillae]|uniref:DUF5052 family protein n=1 Tax=Bacillus massiliigorillae TaxID=1243664 RepID=UPI0003A69D49|nr:DUF5052 family protein [Bacillus massiliigorillae]
MKRKISILVSVILCISILSGCNWFSNELGKLERALKGQEVVIQTYDEESNIIDRVKGKSVSISADEKFDLKDSEGNKVEKSSVISLTVGGNSMLHVGSSLIMREQGLTDVFDEYAQKVDINNNDRSVPFINNMINEVKNLTTGKKKVILIRSQSGKPLATYVGDKVSYFATDVDKSTGLLIDGKYLFIYRCDYTIYDMELLQ